MVFHRRQRFRNAAGMSLVEAVVSMGLFTIMSLGIIAGMVQVRKMSESNASQVTAETVAQGVIERMLITGYTNVRNDSTLPLEFLGFNTATNLCTVQTFLLPWATNATNTDIGEMINPADQTAGVRGILLDMDYRNGTTVIRPRKYMKMRVNLRRTPHDTDNNIEIVLTYSWQPPNRTGTTDADYITREIRTVRSEAVSY
jgi:type II secretory pathway pseudopilin PulG